MKNKGLILGLVGLLGLIANKGRNGNPVAQTSTNIPDVTTPDYYSTVKLSTVPRTATTTQTNQTATTILPSLGWNYDLSQNQYTADPTGQAAAALNVDIARTNAYANSPEYSPYIGGYAADQILAKDAAYQAAVAAKKALDDLETRRMIAYRDKTPEEYLAWRSLNLGY
jgi:hypothetical protein